MGAESYSETVAWRDEPVRLIDISAAQPVANWNRVRYETRLRGVIFKVSQGTQGIDQRFAINYAGARDEGFACGVYHFAQPAFAPGLTLEQDADKEARLLYEKCDGLGSAPGELMPTIDIETFDGLPAKTVAQWLRVYLDQSAQLFQRRSMVYTGAPMAPVFALMPELGDYPLWLAQYPQGVVTKDAKGRALHSAPLTWEQAEARKAPSPLAPWSHVTMWQFSGGSGDGTLPGNWVPGIGPDPKPNRKPWDTDFVPVDCNRFMGTEDDWISFLAMK